MNLALLTKNRRGRRGSPRLSLFPFLAVLICTMGALVLLLLAVTRQARQQALREATAKASQRQGNVEADREAVQWRIEQLQESRKTTEAQLADARLVLGHLEEHARRLRARLEQFRAASKDFDNVKLLASRQRSGTEEELRAIEAKIAESERTLVQARQELQKRPRSYAIIPYEGPNQTHRRPIYLECLADEIVLQPEGIRFSEADFEGPLGAGNPLAAALRAARERMLAQGAIDPRQGGEPYPLLLVRARGIGAFYAARAAMASWGSDFGYELIGDDWPLEFPPRDPGLAQVVAQAVESARLEQKALIAAAPNKYAKRSRKGTYRVSPTGGIVRESGGEDEEEDSGFRSGPAGPRYANRGGSGSGGSAGAREPRGGGGDSAGYYGASGGPTGAAATGATAHGGGRSGTSDASGETDASGESGTAPLPYASAVAAAGAGPSMPAVIGPGVTETPSHGTGAAIPSGAGSNATSPGNAIPPGSRAPRPDGYVAGRPYEPQADQRPSGGGEPGMPLRPGEWHPSPDYTPPPKRDEDREDGKRRKDVKSLAEKRGRDWGLRDAASGSVATTRPIRVQCHADRVVLVPDDPRLGEKVVPFSGPTEGSIDKFIAVVWEHMDSWGIAGRGMYWRPILTFSVAPGGEQRFEELRLLLEGSGLTVRGRN